MVDSQVLKKLNYPAYCVKVLDNGLVALSGGGGTAKTGVDNCLELGKIDYDSEFNATFTTIHNFSTNDAIMKFISFECNSSDVDTHLTLPKNMKTANKPFDLYIVAAVGNSIEIYKLIPTIEKTPETLKSNEATNRERKRSTSSSNEPHTTNNNQTNNTNSNTRKRNNSANKQNNDHKTTLNNHNHHHDNNNNNNNNNNKDLKNVKNGFNVKASARLKSINKITLEDLNDTKNKKQNTTNTINKFEITALAVSQQQCKKIKNPSNPHSNEKNKILLFIGCTNGSIVIYNLFQNQRLSEIKNAHSKEIDDLQVNISSKAHEHLLSVGKDGKAYIWSTHNFEKIKELEHTKLGKSNLRMKHARFSLNSHLYTTYIPMIRNKNPKSFIVKWDSSNYKIEKTHAINNTIITAFQCNQDGKFLCYGDYEGQIELLNENFIHLARFKKQHSIVVTDLAFYHDSLKPYDSNKLILSLSIDRTLQCYKYLNIKTYDNFKYFAILLIIILLFCYFFTYFE